MKQPAFLASSTTAKRMVGRAGWKKKGLFLPATATQPQSREPIAFPTWLRSAELIPARPATLSGLASGGCDVISEARNLNCPRETDHSSCDEIIPQRDVYFSAVFLSHKLTGTSSEVRMRDLRKLDDGR
jgi:hypothetical protein